MPSPSFQDTYRLLSPGNMLTMSANCPRFSPCVADEAFLALKKYAKSDKQVVLDPFCGCGITLCTIATLYRESVTNLLACDIVEKRVETALSNLRLCSVEGLNQFTEEIDIATKIPNKTISRRLEIVPFFKQFLSHYGCHQPLPVQGFHADMLRQGCLDDINYESVDMVLTDPPYGITSNWNGAEAKDRPNESLRIALRNIRPKLKDSAIAGLVYNRGYDAELAGCQEYEYLGSVDIRNRVLYILKSCA
jgi:tRNA G10  N-methylase Trm11